MLRKLFQLTTQTPPRLNGRRGQDRRRHFETLFMRSFKDMRARARNA